MVGGAAPAIAVATCIFGTDHSSEWPPSRPSPAAWLRPVWPAPPAPPGAWWWLPPAPPGEKAGRSTDGRGKQRFREQELQRAVLAGRRWKAAVGVLQLAAQQLGGNQMATLQLVNGSRSRVNTAVLPDSKSRKPRLICLPVAQARVVTRHRSQLMPPLLPLLVFASLQVPRCVNY